MTSKRERARAEMYQRIEAHGRKLLAVFPGATERDPVKLCKKLRTLEREASEHALGLCDVEAYANRPQAEHDRTERRIRDGINRLLNPRPSNGSAVPILINLDPRGYALKVDDDWMREHGNPLPTDAGGYGLLAPDLSGDDS